MATKRSYIKDGLPLYIYDNRQFYNDKHIDFYCVNQLINLRKFPEIFDFNIIYSNKKNITFYYYSESLGMLTNFPYGDIRYFDGNNINEKFCIPNGTVETPYFDAGQGCVIQIFEYRSYIYIMNGLELLSESYYKVKKEIYYKEWTHILEGLKTKMH